MQSVCQTRAKATKHVCFRWGMDLYLEGQRTKFAYQQPWASCIEMKSYPSCLYSADEPPPGVLVGRTGSNGSVPEHSRRETGQGGREMWPQRRTLPRLLFVPGCRGRHTRSKGGRRVGHDLWSYTGRPLTSAMIVGPVQCERAERKRARRAFVLPD